MLTEKTGQFHARAALLVALAMAAVVGAANGFEHIGGYIPCKLCLEQRQPYYAGVPVMLLAAFSAWRGWQPCVTRGLLIIGGLLMAYALVLGIYHSGVEWKWWAGPDDCGAAVIRDLTSGKGGVLGAIDEAIPPSCDDAAGRFLGISFANAQVLGALPLMLASFWLAAAGNPSRG